MTFQISLILFTAFPHPQYNSPFPLSTQSPHPVLFQFSLHHHDYLSFQILTPTQRKLLAFLISDNFPDSILTSKCSGITRENMWYLTFLICYFTHNNNFYSIHLLEIFIISFFFAAEYNSIVYIHLCLLSTIFGRIFRLFLFHNSCKQRGNRH